MSRHIIGQSHKDASRAQQAQGGNVSVNIWPLTGREVCQFVRNHKDDVFPPVQCDHYELYISSQR